MTLFPGERPEYPEGKPEGRRMEIRLHEGKRMTTASCLYCDGEQSRYGRAAVQNTRLTDRIQTDSLCQQIVKLAIYRAVLRSGRKKPVWGALTGVRPGKLMSPMLERGIPEKEALKRFEAEYDVAHDRALLCLDTSKATVRADRLLEAGDVCLYVGIPFCPTRCAYCSFVSQSVEKSMKQIPAFLETLELELHAVAEQIRRNGLRVVSIYMGGGTPTTLDEGQLDRLLTKIETEFDLSALRECTVEAGRPDTMTVGKLHTLRKHGVDRVSVNPQTMSDEVLEAIGRKHSAQDIVRALRQVRETGGFAVNMDLIAGLPTDTEESFRRTVDTVLDLIPENITPRTSPSIPSASNAGRGCTSERGRSPPTRRWRPCSTMQMTGFDRRVTVRTTSTGRRTCPGASRTSDGPGRGMRTSTTSASWRSCAVFSPRGRVAPPS